MRAQQVEPLDLLPFLSPHLLLSPSPVPSAHPRAILTPRARAHTCARQVSLWLGSETDAPTKVAEMDLPATAQYIAKVRASQRSFAKVFWRSLSSTCLPWSFSLGLLSRHGLAFSCQGSAMRLVSRLRACSRVLWACCGCASVNANGTWPPWHPGTSIPTLLLRMLSPTFSHGHVDT